MNAYRRGAPVLAVLVGILAITALGVVLLSGSRPTVASRPAPSPSSAPTSSVHQPEREVRIPVVTEPAGATVFDAADHSVLCKPTPCELTMTRDRAATATVSLELPGRPGALARVSDVVEVPGGGTLMLTFGARVSTASGVVPSLREAGVEVQGPMPQPVVRRIVRQTFGRFRLCYENGLRLNPTLAGRVTTRFTFDATGAVATTADGGSDLPDQAVVSCVVRAFGNLSFPAPEGGARVTVIYPIIFSPSSAPSM